MADDFQATGGFQCPDCPKRCTSVSRLQQHRLARHGSNSDVNPTHEWVDMMHVPAREGMEEMCNPCRPEEPALPTPPAPPALAPDVAFAHMLARARVVNHTARDTLAVIKDAVEGLIRTLRQTAVEKLSPLLKADVDPAEAAAQVFSSLQESLQRLTIRDEELKRVREHSSYMYVEPRKRYLGSKKAEDPEDFWAYDSPLAETLEAIFATRLEPCLSDMSGDVGECRGMSACRMT